MNFGNQQLGHHLVADYTITMSRTLKVTGNHLMYDRGAWFLRVIMSSSRALCFPSVSEEAKHDFQVCFVPSTVVTIFFFVQCIIKQFLDSVFVISRIIKVLVRVISLSLRLPLITPISTLIILDITKTSSNNCLALVRLEKVPEYTWMISKISSCESTIGF